MGTGAYYDTGTVQIKFARGSHGTPLLLVCPSVVHICTCRCVGRFGTIRFCRVYELHYRNALFWSFGVLISSSSAFQAMLVLQSGE